MVPLVDSTTCEIRFPAECDEVRHIDIPTGIAALVWSSGRQIHYRESK
jgi:hypothetical protein